MNHPNREEWMSFLYEDIDASEKNRLSTHLDSCDACRRQIAAWRGTMASLNAWSVAAPAPRDASRKSWFRWAAAAAVFLAVGIGIGAVARGAGPESAELRELRKELQAVAAVAKSQQETIELITQTVAENRTRDQETLLVTLREMEGRRQTELRALRKDLETVAALTEESLDNTHNQLARLASYTR
jgi:hypothetical protein